MENCCRKVCFCDSELVCRTFAGRYSFVIRSQCGEHLQKGIVLLCVASVENCYKKVLFCDVALVWRTVVGRYSFVIWSQCGKLLQEDIM